MGGITFYDIPSFPSADRTKNWLSASGRKQDGIPPPWYQSVLSVILGMKLRTPSIAMHSSFPWANGWASWRRLIQSSNSDWVVLYGGHVPYLMALTRGGFLRCDLILLSSAAGKLRDVIAINPFAPKNFNTDQLWRTHVR